MLPKEILQSSRRLNCQGIHWQPYPELACTSGPFQAPTTSGGFEDVYCQGFYKVVVNIEQVQANGYLISMEPEILNPKIRYSNDSTLPNGKSSLYNKPFVAGKEVKVNTAIFENGQMKEKPTMLDLSLVD